MAMLTKHTNSLLCLVVLLVGALGVASMAMALEVGEKAPDFTLPSTTGEEISLSQFRGKKLVLIEFYVADFSGTWTDNLSARKVDHRKFQDLDVQILGISADNPFSQRTFADSLQLPYPLLSDHPDLQVIRGYGILSSSQKTAQRAFFLIDKEGIVRGRWLVENTEVFPSELILRMVREIAEQS